MLVTLCGLFALSKSLHKDDKVCYSITNGLSYTKDMYRFKYYLDMYGGCTKIVGPLELTYLNLSRAENMDFLTNIIEITDYLLIYNFTAKELKLPNLRIIGGNNLYIGNALMIINSNLDEFDIHSLIEISTGSVYMNNVRRVHGLGGINFEDFLVDLKKQKIRVDSLPEKPKCSSKCAAYNGVRYCFSKTQCQFLRRLTCRLRCRHQCYLQKEIIVCGEKKSKQNLENVERVLIDSRFSTTSNVTCPVGKLPFRNFCLTINPTKDNYLCRTYRNGDVVHINRSNIHRFKDCVIVEGNLVYMTPQYKISNLDFFSLNSVQVVTGFVGLIAPVEAESFRFLGNLEFVGGDMLFMGNSVTMYDYYSRNLTKLALYGIRVIHGNSLFYTPKILCIQYSLLKRAMNKQNKFQIYCNSGNGRIVIEHS